jgi:hypothetical protein
MRPDVHANNRLGPGFAAVSVVICLLSVTACTQETPEPNSAPAVAATKTPLFASDEEALNAARATYEGFLATSDTILLEGGRSIERLDDYATAELAENEKRAIAEFITTGGTATGQTVLENAVLQAHRPSAQRGESVVSIYTCVNVSSVEMVDVNGRSIVAADRSERTAFEVTFDASETSQNKLRVASNLLWTGEGVC